MDDDEIDFEKLYLFVAAERDAAWKEIERLKSELSNLGGKLLDAQEARQIELDLLIKEKIKCSKLRGEVGNLESALKLAYEQVADLRVENNQLRAAISRAEEAARLSRVEAAKGVRCFCGAPLAKNGGHCTKPENHDNFRDRGPLAIMD